MKIVFLCALLCLSYVAASPRGHHGGKGDRDPCKKRGEKISSICATYSDAAKCTAAGEKCFGSCENKGRPPKNPLSSEQKAEVDTCLADNPELAITDNRGHLKLRDVLKEIDTVASTADAVTIQALDTIRCCVQQATQKYYTAEGVLKTADIKEKLSAKITDAAALEALLSGVDTCEAKAQIENGCNFKEFKDCYMKACIDSVIEP